MAKRDRTKAGFLAGAADVRKRRRIEEAAMDDDGLRMIAKAAREGWIAPWKVKAEHFRTLPEKLGEVAIEAAEAGDVKGAAMAAGVVRGFISDNVRFAEVVEKAQRLDEGTVTDRLEIVSPEAEAIAKRLLERRRG